MSIKKIYLLSAVTLSLPILISGCQVSEVEYPPTAIATQQAAIYTGPNFSIPAISGNWKAHRVTTDCAVSLHARSRNSKGHYTATTNACRTDTQLQNIKAWNINSGKIVLHGDSGAIDTLSPVHKNKFVGKQITLTRCPKSGACSL